MDKTKILVALAAAIAVAVVVTFACTSGPEPEPVVTVSAVAPIASPALVAVPAPIVAEKATPKASPKAPKAKAKGQSKAEKEAYAKAGMNAYRAECRLFAADVLAEFYVRRGTDLTPDPRDNGLLPMSDPDCLQWLLLKRKLVDLGLFPFDP